MRADTMTPTNTCPAAELNENYRQLNPLILLILLEKLIKFIEIYFMP